MLYRFITGTEDDRNNRKHLRNFKGFYFANESKDFEEKVKWAVTSFTSSELIVICTVLNINYSGKSEEVTHRICAYLVDLSRLMAANAPTTASETEDSVDEETAKYTVRQWQLNTDSPPASKRGGSSDGDEVPQEIATISIPLKCALHFRDTKDSIQ